MAARRYQHIVCDTYGNCGNAYPAEPEPFSTVGLVSRSIAEIRREAAAHGWLVRQGNGHTGADVCPGCQRAESPMWP